jgi:hypothetical protein
MSEAARRDTFLSASGKLVLLDKLLPKLRTEAHCVLISNPNPNPDPNPNPYSNPHT